MSQVQAAVIIPHFNDVTRLLRCLEALMPQVDERVEVVVVDNASTDSLAAVSAAYEGLRIINEPQKGAANARDVGVAKTTAPLFFSGLRLYCRPPDWLATALRVAGRADLVGGEVAVFDETPPPRTGAQAFETVFAFDNRSYVETKGF